MDFCMWYGGHVNMGMALHKGAKWLMCRLQMLQSRRRTSGVSFVPDVEGELEVWIMEIV